MDEKPWHRYEVAPAALEVPAMLTYEERAYLQWLTEDHFEGWGAVVDLGPWIGASTAALAEGLRRGGHEAVVHSYDLFEWDPYMAATLDVDLPAGGDFLAEFRRRVGPWSERVEPHQGDLLEAVWEGGPIEVLFVDAAKTWELLRAILTVFGPALVPGRTRVVLQDFRHFSAYWLPLVFDGHPEVWEPREAVDRGTTATFTPLVEVGADDGSGLDLRDEDYSYELAASILTPRINAETGASRFHLRLTLLFVALLRGADEAVAELSAMVLRPVPLVDGDAQKRLSRHRRSLRKATQAAERGRLSGAVRRARALADDDEADWTIRTQALLLLGRIAERDGRHDDAEVQYHEGLLVAFDNQPTVRGWSAFERGDLTEAHRQVELCIEVDGETAEATFLLGRIHQEAGRLDEAFAAFQRARSLDPDHEAARVAVETWPPTAAYEAFDRATKGRPSALSSEAGLAEASRLVDAHGAEHGESAETWFLVGRIAQTRGDLSEARDAFTEAVALDPDHQWSQKHLTEVTSRLDREDTGS